MKLKCIINNGKCMENSDVRKIIDEIIKIPNFCTNRTLYQTLDLKINKEKVNRSMNLFFNRSKNNLYIELQGINDPISFYQFLSENKYILKDARITKEKGE